MSLNQDQLWQQQNSTNVPVRVGVKRRATAPYATIDSLYNLNSTLYWNGAPVITGSGGSFTLANNEMFVGDGGVPTAKSLVVGLDGGVTGFYQSARYFATFFRTDGATQKPGRVTAGFNEIRMWKNTGENPALPSTLQPQHRLSRLLITDTSTNNGMNIYPTVKIMSSEPSTAKATFTFFKGYGATTQGSINDVSTVTEEGFAKDTMLIGQLTEPTLRISENATNWQVYSNSATAASAWATDNQNAANYRAQGDTNNLGAFYSTKNLRASFLVGDQAPQAGGGSIATPLTYAAPLTLRTRSQIGTTSATRGREPCAQGVLTTYFTDITNNAGNAADQVDDTLIGSPIVVIGNDFNPTLSADSINGHSGVAASPTFGLANTFHIDLANASGTSLMVTLPNFQGNDIAGFQMTFILNFGTQVSNTVGFRMGSAGVLRYGSESVGSATDNYHIESGSGALTPTATTSKMFFKGASGTASNVTTLVSGIVHCMYLGRGRCGVSGQSWRLWTGDQP